MTAKVLAVHCKALHTFSKDHVHEIELIAGHGVRGDAHFGVTVKHRSRVARDPTQPNLRQVHLLQEELLSEVLKLGHVVAHGQMGENITTQGIDLLGLSAGSQLCLGADAVIEVTGLRNPCAQIEAFKPGLLSAVLDRTAEGTLIRKAGVMAIVLKGGAVKSGDEIVVVHAPYPPIPLHPV
jgi:MOSC domain-containing protein YiiM